MPEMYAGDSLTIEQTKKLLDNLEYEISSKLQDFTEKTGLAIDTISIQHIVHSDDSVAGYLIKLNARFD